jgi:SagB-type dehydrogenase family enzyme
MNFARLLLSGLFFVLAASPPPAVNAAEEEIKLPQVVFKGQTSVEAAIKARNTERGFGSAALTLAEASQLLWAANGNVPPDAVTGATRKVTPSAGGLYPLEVFVLTGNKTVGDLPAGVYRYEGGSHSLFTVTAGDKRSLVASAAFQQMWLARAPAIILIAGVFQRTTVKYGQRGVNYVFMESGAANQNLCLQAEALGLKAGTVGAFNDAPVAAAAGLPQNIAPLLIVAVGK